MSIRIEVAVRVTENEIPLLEEARVTSLIVSPDTSVSDDLGELGGALNAQIDEVRSSLLDQIAGHARAQARGAGDA